MDLKEFEEHCKRYTEPFEFVGYMSKKDNKIHLGIRSKKGISPTNFLYDEFKQEVKEKEKEFPILKILLDQKKGGL